jgi:hypothetical protein
MKSENTLELKKERVECPIALFKQNHRRSMQYSFICCVQEYYSCNSDADCKGAINFMANHRAHLHFLFAFLTLPKGHLLVQHVLEPSLHQQVKTCLDDMVIALERVGSLPSLLLREHRFSDFAGILTQWQEMMNVWQLLEKIGFSPDDHAVALFPMHVITKLRECAEKVPSHQSMLLESKEVITDCFSKVDQLSFQRDFLMSQILLNSISGMSAYCNVPTN